MCIRDSTYTNVLQKVGEAKLFKEQGENTSLWYAYNYSVDGLDFNFKTPEAWNREESFDKGIKVIFTEEEGRKIILETRSVIQTCSEYMLNISNSPIIKVKSSEFIDLGQFGVGAYIKYGIVGDGVTQYHADILSLIHISEPTRPY